jgi:hypothetical protein
MKTRPKPNAVGDGELTYPGLDCNDTNTNIYYVGVHAVSKNDFDALIKEYFNGTYKEPKTFPIDVSKNDCDDYIKWDNKGTKGDNGDLDVKIVVAKKETGKYSVHFFKGLGILFPTGKTFQFSKAYNKNIAKDTAVIRVLDAANKPVYHGDLTHMFP